ncbi:MAG: DUF3473 domain-containing protein, partial [Planctomycetaceae bacterium]
RQPRLSGSLRSRFRHYVNLGTTDSKLRFLLRSFRFGTLTETLRGEQSRLVESELQPRLRVGAPPVQVAITN